jgi:hypothetical protein
MIHVPMSHQCRIYYCAQGPVGQGEGAHLPSKNFCLCGAIEVNLLWKSCPRKFFPTGNDV